jgi:hypothetical protein
MLAGLRSHVRSSFSSATLTSAPRPGTHSSTGPTSPPPSATCRRTASETNVPTRKSDLRGLWRRRESNPRTIPTGVPWPNGRRRLNGETAKAHPSRLPPLQASTAARRNVLGRPLPRLPRRLRAQEAQSHRSADPREGEGGRHRGARRAGVPGRGSPAEATTREASLSPNGPCFTSSQRLGRLHRRQPLRRLKAQTQT